MFCIALFQGRKPKTLSVWVNEVILYSIHELYSEMLTNKIAKTEYKPKYNLYVIIIILFYFIFLMQTGK